MASVLFLVVHCVSSEHFGSALYGFNVCLDRVIHGLRAFMVM